MSTELRAGMVIRTEDGQTWLVGRRTKRPVSMALGRPPFRGKQTIDGVLLICWRNGEFEEITWEHRETGMFEGAYKQDYVLITEGRKPRGRKR